MKNPKRRRASAAFPAFVPANRVTKARIEAWIYEWAERLGLRDWHISYALKRAWDMSGSAVGEITIGAATSNASIDFLTPGDLHPYGYEKTNYELIVVHELMHLRFHVAEGAWPRDKRDPLAHIAHESAIHYAAKAMLAAKYGYKSYNHLLAEYRQHEATS